MLDLHQRRVGPASTEAVFLNEKSSVRAGQVVREWKCECSWSRTLSIIDRERTASCAGSSRLHKPESHAFFGGTRALHELAMHWGRVRAAAVNCACQHGGRGGWRASVHRACGAVGAE